jgi:hypothetical protein
MTSLQTLAGEWEVEMVSEGEVVARARISSEWIGDGDFLVHRSQT